MYGKSSDLRLITFHVAETMCHICKVLSLREQVSLLSPSLCPALQALINQTFRTLTAQEAGKVQSLNCLFLCRQAERCLRG